MEGSTRKSCHLKDKPHFTDKRTTEDDIWAEDKVMQEWECPKALTLFAGTEVALQGDGKRGWRASEGLIVKTLLCRVKGESPLEGRQALISLVKMPKTARYQWACEGSRPHYRQQGGILSVGNWKIIKTDLVWFLSSQDDNSKQYLW